MDIVIFVVVVVVVVIILGCGGVLEVGSVCYREIAPVKFCWVMLATELDVLGHICIARKDWGQSVAMLPAEYLCCG